MTNEYIEEIAIEECEKEMRDKAVSSMASSVNAKEFARLKEREKNAQQCSNVKHGRCFGRCKKSETNCG